jgi:hypothetical protein
MFNKLISAMPAAPEAVKVVVCMADAGPILSEKKERHVANIFGNINPRLKYIINKGEIK